MKRQLVKSKEPAPKVYKLYIYLKENAVGYANRVSAKTIIASLSDTFFTRQDVESAIQTIRTSFDRKVGSTTTGYWLECTDDEVKGDTYMINQVLSKMEIAIRAGVDPNVFYHKLNEIKDKWNNTLDKQQRLTFGDYENTEIRRYSDDLR